MRRLIFRGSVVFASGALLFLFVRAVSEHITHSLDFIFFYAAGRAFSIYGAAATYNPSVTNAIIRSMHPTRTPLPWNHTPVENLFLAAIAQLPFVWAYWLWCALGLLAVYFGTTALLHRRDLPLGEKSAIAWTALAVPTIGMALVFGQDGLFLVPIFAGCYLALKDRKEEDAGLIAGLRLFRFELLIPFAFIFLLRRRWRFLWGFALCGTAFTLLSIALVGPAGVLAYGRILIAYAQPEGRSSSAPLAVMMLTTFRGLVASTVGRFLPPTVTLACVVALSLAVCFFAALSLGSIDSPLRSEFEWQFSAAVLASILASYHLLIVCLAVLLVPAAVTLPPEPDRSSRPSAARWLWFSMGATAITIISRASLWLCLLVIPMLALFFWSVFHSHVAVRETQKV